MECLTNRSEHFKCFTKLVAAFLISNIIIGDSGAQWYGKSFQRIERSCDVESVTVTHSLFGVA